MTEKSYHTKEQFLAGVMRAKRKVESGRSGHPLKERLYVFAFLQIEFSHMIKVCTDVAKGGKERVSFLTERLKILFVDDEKERFSFDMVRMDEQTFKRSDNQDVMSEAFIKMIVK